MRTRRPLAGLVAIAALLSCNDSTRGAADGGDVGVPDATGVVRVAVAPGPVCALALDGSDLIGVSGGAPPTPTVLWRLSDTGIDVLDSVEPTSPWGGTCLLAVGDGAAWWVGEFAPSLRRTDLATGETSGPIADGVTGLDVGGGYTWWTSHHEGRVYRAPESGGDVEPFAEAETPTGIVADADVVWVMERLPTVLLRLDPVTAEAEFFATWLGDNTMTLFDGPDDLVWPSHSSGLLHAVSKSGGDVRAIGDATAGQMSVTGTDVFTAPHRYDFAREVRRVALDGSGSVTLATVGEECPVGIAAGEAFVWWTDCDGGIWRSP